MKRDQINSYRIRLSRCKHIPLYVPANTRFNQHTPTTFMHASKPFILYNFMFFFTLCIVIHNRVSFCDGSFYDNSLLRPLSSLTEHSRLMVQHCRNSSVLSLLSALLALFRVHVFLLFLF